MTNTDWEIIKDFYKERFGIDGWLVEMYANLDILSLCVAGACNDNIVKFLELPSEEVVRVINDVFEFDGFVNDLPINPYRVYNSYNGIRSSVEHLTSFLSDTSVELGSILKPEKLFKICDTYSDIEERIQNEWI